MLLLPSNDPVVYKQKAKVDRTFRLRQVAPKPNTGTGEKSSGANGSSASETTSFNGASYTAQVPLKKKEPRKQPERLGYRFAPLGVEKPAPEDDDSVHLAESVLLKAISQGRSGDVLAAEEKSANPEKRKKDKKKKKSKGTEESGV